MFVFLFCFVSQLARNFYNKGNPLRSFDHVCTKDNSTCEGPVDYVKTVSDRSRLSSAGYNNIA